MASREIIGNESLSMDLLDDVGVGAYDAGRSKEFPQLRFASMRLDIESLTITYYCTG